MKNLKVLLKVVFSRTLFIIIFLLIQLAVLLAAFTWLGEYLTYAYWIYAIFGTIVVIYILNEKENPSFKLAWMIPVLVFPVFGSLFYLYVNFQFRTKLIARRLTDLSKDTKPYLKQNPKVIQNLEKISRRSANLSGYMMDYGGYPTYEKTNVTYFPSGELKFEEMKKQLEKAVHFIFLEYFIVEPGIMWDSILEILERKVKEGVEVRFLYDGMCSIVLLPHSYPKQMEAKGIRCKMFSPIKPALSTYQNNRDHRKILVVDGHTAFTGGINLADEYINKKVKYGHWKDTAIMLKGDAVTSFTMMFLQMWNVFGKETEDYGRYLRHEDYFYPPELPMDGFVMPYGDSPLDHENVGEYVYFDILYQARKYVHIMTPYLILDNEMVTAMCYSAKRGIETIIIMPHVPDKIYAYLLARSFYQELIEAGVQIYEYTPGFVHAKVFTSDDQKAVVGTINLDFRSLYMHFECAAYLYRCSAVKDVEKDFQATLRQSRKITLQDCRRYPVLKKIGGRFLRLFAPLM